MQSPKSHLNQTWKKVSTWFVPGWIPFQWSQNKLSPSQTQWWDRVCTHTHTHTPKRKNGQEERKGMNRQVQNPTDIKASNSHSTHVLLPGRAGWSGLPKRQAVMPMWPWGPTSAVLLGQSVLAALKGQHSRRWPIVPTPIHSSTHVTSYFSIVPTGASSGTLPCDQSLPGHPGALWHLLKSRRKHPLPPQFLCWVQQQS